MINYPHSVLDTNIVLFFNGLCGKNQSLDTVWLIFLSTDALRTAILVAFIIGIWEYGKIKNDASANQKVIKTFLTIVLTLGIIEILNAVINSPRPIVSYSNLNIPILHPDTKALWVDSWIRNAKHGSFPSDTIALLAALASGIFSWNKTLGIFAFIFVFIAGIFPRLYFGLHYPSDMLLGMLIAGFSSYTINKLTFFSLLSNKVIDIEKKFPYLFGVLGFYLAYIIADKFILLRKLPVWLRVIFGS